MTLSYAVITPARNEARRLPCLADCLVAQTVRPAVWVIVDSASNDGTPELAAELAGRNDWVRALEVDMPEAQARGGPVVRAFVTALEVLPEMPDVVVKLDADLTMEPDYFKRLLAAFADDATLGIASGVCLELQAGEWRPSFGTRSHVWGAARAYRRECLRDVLPLEERQGWDEIDALKARLNGWKTRTLFELPFRHHRALGERDGKRRRWLDQGETAHYMAYRFSYLLARTCYRVLLEPQAAMMLWGYARAMLRRQPQLEDAAARNYLREQQRLRTMPLRVSEVLGRRRH
jgi:biofilm PGA synthesis N-glycosyltransferase PgaC